MKKQKRIIKFECETKCKDQFIKSVSLGCRKCIKQTMIIPLTTSQQNEIAKIIGFKNI